MWFVLNAIKKTDLTLFEYLYKLYFGLKIKFVCSFIRIFF